MTLITLYNFICLFFLVEMPNGRYRGQKLIKEVRMKMPARTSKMMASVPEITLVKNKMTITTATSILVILSTAPIFFFMLFIVNSDWIILWQMSNYENYYTVTFVTQAASVICWCPFLITSFQVNYFSEAFVFHFPCSKGATMTGLTINKYYFIPVEWIHIPAKMKFKKTKIQGIFHMRSVVLWWSAYIYQIKIYTILKNVGIQTGT